MRAVALYGALLLAASTADCSGCSGCGSTDEEADAEIGALFDRVVVSPDILELQTGDRGLILHFSDAGSPAPWHAAYRVGEATIASMTAVAPSEEVNVLTHEGDGASGSVHYSTTPVRPSRIHFEVTCHTVGETTVHFDTTMGDEPPGKRQEEVAIRCTESGWAPQGSTLVRLGDLVFGDPDFFCASTTDDTDTDDIRHSNGVIVIGQPTNAQGIRQRAADTAELTPEDVARIEGISRTALADLVLGPNPGPELLPGDVAVFAMQMFEPIPLSQAADLFQYAFVFDADDDPSNNFLASPSFPADFFDDTDRWYVAAYDPSIGWDLQVTDARDGGFADITDSRARMVFVGDVLALVVPTNEFEAEVLPYRMTAFRHTGDFGIGSGDWHGDVEPPVDVGLHDLDLGAR